MRELNRKDAKAPRNLTTDDTDAHGWCRQQSPAFLKLLSVFIRVYLWLKKTLCLCGSKRTVGHSVWLFTRFQFSGNLPCLQIKDGNQVSIGVCDICAFSIWMNQNADRN